MLILLLLRRCYCHSAAAGTALLLLLLLLLLPPQLLLPLCRSYCRRRPREAPSGKKDEPESGKPGEGTEMGIMPKEGRVLWLEDERRLRLKLSASILSSRPNSATLPSLSIRNLVLGAAADEQVAAWCPPTGRLAGAGMGTYEPSGPSTSLKKATRLAVISGNVGRS